MKIAENKVIFLLKKLLTRYSSILPVIIILILTQTACAPDTIWKWRTRSNDLVDTTTPVFLKAKYICLKEAQKINTAGYDSFSDNLKIAGSKPAYNADQRATNNFLIGFSSGWQASAIEDEDKQQLIYESCMNMFGFFLKAEAKE